MNQLTNLRPNEIDEILDEIERHERKIDMKSNENDKDYINVNWDDILKQIGNGNVNFIKNLITANDININSKNPMNGKTLLIYSVIRGDIDLVRVICNFGADVHIVDDHEMDALDYAIKYGRYNITELVYYQQLSGSLGN
eukprot:251785_1